MRAGLDFSTAVPTWECSLARHHTSPDSCHQSSLRQDSQVGVLAWHMKLHQVPGPSLSLPNREPEAGCGSHLHSPFQNLAPRPPPPAQTLPCPQPPTPVLLRTEHSTPLTPIPSTFPYAARSSPKAGMSCLRENIELFTYSQLQLLERKAILSLRP